jgi:hypothetical protein
MFGTVGALSRLEPDYRWTVLWDWERTNCDVHLMCGVRTTLIAWLTVPFPLVLKLHCNSRFDRNLAVHFGSDPTLREP